MKDPAFLDEVKKRNHGLDAATGEEPEGIVKEAMSQPPLIVERKKRFSGDNSKGGRRFQ
jgi:hypothetical protein